jgi:hypothetical protein
MTPQTLDVLLVLTAVLITLVLTRWLRSMRGSLRARRRAARAGAGEDIAAILLEEAGFIVIERQARVDWAPLVYLEGPSESGPLHLGGEPHHLELRADYLVERDGELLVAEVKTGAEAPNLDTAATRRQLLEYHVAFAADGVLLVCPERNTIQRVVFPTLR